MDIFSKTSFCGTDFTFYSNISKVDGQNQVVLVGKWTNELKASDFDPTRHVHLTFHVDTSGSMNDTMETKHYGRSQGRIDIVKQALLEAIGMFSQAVSDGLSLGVSIVAFNTSAHVVFHENKLSMEDFPNLEARIRGIMAGGGTSISNTILKGKEIDLEIQAFLDSQNTSMGGSYTKCENIRILLSDGYHNSGLNRDEVMSEFKKYFQVCIGIGTPENYDVELLNAIQQDNETSGADKMEDALDLMVDSLFGPVSRVAQDVEITVEGLKEVDGKTSIQTNFRQYCDQTKKFIIPDIAYHQPIIIQGILTGDEVSLIMKYRQDVKTKTDTKTFNYVDHDISENETNLHQAIGTLLEVPKLLEDYGKNVTDHSLHTKVVSKKGDMEKVSDYLENLGKVEEGTKNFYYTGLMAKGIMESLNRISTFDTHDSYATPMMSQYMTTTISQTKKAKMASVSRTASSGYSAASPYRPSSDVTHHLPVIGRQNATPLYSGGSCPPPVALNYGLSAMPTIPSTDNLGGAFSTGSVAPMTPRRHTTEPTKHVHFPTSP